MKKWRFLFFVLLFSVFPVGDPGGAPSGSILLPDALAQEFKPTHELQVDLWVRAGVPQYSFRTGEWVLGDTIGILKKGTKVRVLNETVIGFTQLWLEVEYRLPDGSVRGGPGHWIWAGQKESRENVRPLPSLSGGRSLPDPFPLSLIKEAWAQGDSLPGAAPQGATDPPENLPVPEGKDIIKGLNNRTFLFWSYVGIYLFLLVGMSLGAVWEWLSPKSAEKNDLNFDSFLKPVLRIFIGSVISFSIFIGPIMGIGSMGLTFTSALIAFHFGLVHSDPTDLITSLKQRRLVKQ